MPHAASDADLTKLLAIAHEFTEAFKHADVDRVMQFYGDTYVEDRDGNISISPAGPFNVQATSSSGNADVEITLPPNAAATVEGRTHNGDIVSDFPLTINGDESKTVEGRIGSGNAKINVSTDVGDVRIKKGSGFPPAPPAVTMTTPTPPAAPGAPHLKAPKTPPAEPVTQ